MIVRRLLRLEKLSTRRKVRAETEAIAGAFDPDFYLENNPDVARYSGSPLEHFVRHGWREGRDPAPGFSVKDYLLANPDVAEAGVNPFWHYVVAGREEGRALVVGRSDREAEVVAPDGMSSAQVAADIRGFFDEEFYLSNNPDVRSKGMDPIDHFVLFGWQEGRNPSDSFSVDYYLQTNADVREAGLNPFWHYVVAGRKEGRHPRHLGGHAADRLVQTKPLEEAIAVNCPLLEPATETTGSEIASAILNAKGSSDLVVSIGHDNYRNVSGGVQFCIQQEEEIARRRGVHYLNLHPFRPLPRLAHDAETPDVWVSLVLGGASIGISRMSEVIKAISSLSRESWKISVIVHHFLGHSPEQIAALVRASGNDRCYLWVHDFFLQCPSYALQRNGVNYCAAPPLMSNSCTLCLYGEERKSHTQRIEQFISDLSVQLIAPSSFAANFWFKKSSFDCSPPIVCEHMNTVWERRQVETSQSDDAITIAYVGYPAAHKGWPTFMKVVRALGGTDSRFRFVYFGSSIVQHDEIETMSVQVSNEDPDAMVRALEECDVDIVLHWATWPETFSFSTQEALAGGAYVLTNPTSGNVAETVLRTGCGMVLEDESQLLEFLAGDRIDQMVSEARGRRSCFGPTLTRSEFTFGVIDKEASE